nr:uncharacterized protein LOC117166270 [Bombus vancouverensis nearcticus]
MSKQITPEGVIRFTWFSVALSFCWPLSDDSSRSRVLGFRILQISAVVNAFLMLVTSIYSFFLNLDNMTALFRCIFQVIYTAQLILQTFICWKKRDSLQRIIREMMKCINEAKQYERKIFDAYIAKCNIFYGSYVVILYIAALCFTLGTLFLSSALPLSIEYPFPINYTAVSLVINLHYIILFITCAAHVCMCVFGALLLWFTAARFECLAVEFEATTNISMLIYCIKKQLYLRRYAEEVVGCFRFMVFYFLSLATFFVTGLGIILVIDTPTITRMEFVSHSSFSLMHVYMYAWPADLVQDISENASRSAYDMKWYEQSLEMRKYILNVLVYQKPVTLSVGCLMPELTLRFFCSFMSNALSFCTGLRAMVQDEPE